MQTPRTLQGGGSSLVVSLAPLIWLNPAMGNPGCGATLRGWGRCSEPKQPPRSDSAHISYLLLHYKLPQHLAWNNSTYYSLEGFCRSGILEWFSWVILGWGLLWSESQDVGWGYRHLKAWVRPEDMLLRWLPQWKIEEKTQIKLLGMRSTICEWKIQWMGLIADLIFQIKRLQNLKI